MRKLSSMFVAIVLVLTAVHETGAQRPPDQPKPPPPPAAPQPEQPAQRAARESRDPPAQLVNIRLDFVIIDEGGPQPSRKTVAITLADQQQGAVRAAVAVPGVGEFPLLVDALPRLERDGKIRARVTLDYQPNPGGGPGQQKTPDATPSMRLSFGILLENGKRIVAAQAADPLTDRRVSVELTATVLK